jgi:hypothetical protein
MTRVKQQTGLLSNSTTTQSGGLQRVVYKKHPYDHTTSVTLEMSSIMSSLERGPLKKSEPPSPLNRQSVYHHTANQKPHDLYTVVTTCCLPRSTRVAPLFLSLHYFLSSRRVVARGLQSNLRHLSHHLLVHNLVHPLHSLTSSGAWEFV